MARVLAFNVTDPAKKRELQILALRMNFPVITVEREKQGNRIRDLLAGDAPRTPVPRPFSEEMLVMDGFEHPDLNFLLNELIRTGHPFALKAVVTPTNLEWTASELYLRLKAENLSMQNRRSGSSK